MFHYWSFLAANIPRDHAAIDLENLDPVNVDAPTQISLGLDSLAFLFSTPDTPPPPRVCKVHHHQNKQYGFCLFQFQYFIMLSKYHV